MGDKMVNALENLVNTVVPYNPPLVAPSPYPIIPAGTTTAKRERLRAKHAIDVKFWTTKEHARCITVNIGAEAVEIFVNA